jgi:hypothetical protein
MASALLQFARGGHCAARGTLLAAAARSVSGARRFASDTDATARAATPTPQEHKTPSKYVRARAGGDVSVVMRCTLTFASFAPAPTRTRALLACAPHSPRTALPSRLFARRRGRARRG